MMRSALNGAMFGVAVGASAVGALCNSIPMLCTGFASLTIAFAVTYLAKVLSA